MISIAKKKKLYCDAEEKIQPKTLILSVFFEGFQGPSCSKTGNWAVVMEIVMVKWKRNYQAVSVMVSALQKFTVFKFHRIVRAD
jgi:hypothetical protein